jgi:hypothetical protein
LSLLKYKLFTLVLLLLISSKTFSQSEVFEDGEELSYDVSYSFINIGSVIFNTQKKSGTENVFLCKAVMKSNESLPFVYVNYEFYSEIEITNGKVRPHKFTAYETNKDGKRSILTTDFNSDSNFIHIKKTGFTGDVEANKKINTSTVFQDGLSIFYYARYNTGNSGSLNVPVIMYVDSASMKMNTNIDKTNVSIGAVDYDVSSVYLDGFAYFTAVFGLTGDFSGWFSNDAARIPLKAKLKVKIGNVTLELKSWKRKNWSTPRY